MAKVNLSELQDAVEFAGSGDMLQVFAYVDTWTGRVIVFSEDFQPEDEEVPEDLETNDRYLAVPTKRDLDLGRALVERFVAEQLPRDYETVKGYFRARGAYRRFKDLLDHRDKTESWYAFETAATLEALKQWCSDNGLDVADEPSAT